MHDQSARRSHQVISRLNLNSYRVILQGKTVPSLILEYTGIIGLNSQSPLFQTLHLPCLKYTEPCKETQMSGRAVQTKHSMALALARWTKNPQ